MLNKRQESSELVHLEISIETNIVDAFRLKLQVEAEIRGFRVVHDELTFYYIEFNAVNTADKSRYPLGFWPGLTSKLEEAESRLAQICQNYPDIKSVTAKS